MMDLAAAAAAVNGRVAGANPRFARVTTDSRAVEPGDLFVALPGERFDGHDFVAGAFERLVGGQVHQLQLVGLVQDPVGHPLAHGHAAHALDHVRHTL